MAVKVMSPEQLFDSLGQVTGFDRQTERAQARAKADCRKFVCNFYKGAGSCSCHCCRHGRLNDIDPLRRNYTRKLAGPGVKAAFGSEHCGAHHSLASRYDGCMAVVAFV